MSPSLHMGSIAARSAAVELIRMQASSQGSAGWASSAADLAQGLVKCLKLPGQQHRVLHAAAASAWAAVMRSGHASQIGSDIVQEMREAADRLCEEDAGKARAEAQQLLSVLAASNSAGKGGDPMLEG